MEQKKEYYAFISYKREDEKWAKWLQNKLEHYKFPTNLNGRTDLPKNIRPTFRDVTDLTPGLLSEEIDKALCSSEWLIVICSPRSAKSPWVCKEAQTFIDSGRADHIIPFVIEGSPFSKDVNTECYPKALLNLTDGKELLAANINELGRDAAAIKVVACMFSLHFDTLWQRFERERRHKYKIGVFFLLFLVLISLFISLYISNLNTELRGKFGASIASNAKSLIKEGDYHTALLLALEIAHDKKYPYIPSIECVIREAVDSIKYSRNYTKIDYYGSYVDGHIIFSPNGKYVVIPHNDYMGLDIQQDIINLFTGKRLMNKDEILSFVSDSLCYMYSKSEDVTMLANLDNGNVSQIIDGKWFSSPNPNRLISFDKDTIYTYNVETKIKRSALLSGCYEKIKFNEKGDAFFVTTSHCGTDSLLILDIDLNQINTQTLISSIYDPIWVNNSMLLYSNNSSEDVIQHIYSGELTYITPRRFITTLCNIPKTNRCIFNDRNRKGMVYCYNSEASCIDSLYVNDYQITEVCVDENSSKVAIGNENGEVYVYDIKLNELIDYYKEHNSEINRLVFSNNGSFLVSGDEEENAVIRNFNPYHRTTYDTDEYHYLASFSYDNNFLIISDVHYDRPRVQIINLNTRESKTLGTTGCSEDFEYIVSMTISIDNKYIAITSCYFDDVEDSFSGITYLWNIETGECIKIDTPEIPSTCIFTLDNKYLSISLLDGDLCIYNLQTKNKQIFHMGDKEDYFKIWDNNVIKVHYDEPLGAWLQLAGTIDPRQYPVSSIAYDCSMVPFCVRNKYLLGNKYRKKVYKIICDSETNEELYSIDSNWIIFSNDATKIVVNKDKSVEIREFPHYDDLIDEARKMLNGRVITENEKKRYKL